MQINQSQTGSKTSFYDLSMKKSSGENLDLITLKNKKILIVNTASDCGFTPQYDGLQKLYIENKSDLVVIAFPSNDFGEQEKKNDHAIEDFCKINFGVTFPLMSKSTVIKNAEQNEVFKWLTDSSKNGWNDKAPSWNFCKYLIDENGNLTHFFEAAIEPTDKKIMDAIQSKT
ncbi:MAG: glutathione peroxidase [Ferruginibacter sp.]